MSVVSVILPCYNVAPTIDETLDSLARQTLSDFEVIAVDDGSDDPTRERLAAWAARDSRFRVFSQPHAGVIAVADTLKEDSIDAIRELHRMGGMRGMWQV
ncbi:MAG TPA: glycosyltransferase [Anaerolineae bacterium]|nr:glycosyltransferase [Anaerolineae bacterium]